jgi:hypothetical protein
LRPRTARRRSSRFLIGRTFLIPRPFSLGSAATFRTGAIAEQAIAKAPALFVPWNLEALARVLVRAAGTPVAASMFALRAERRAREPLLFLRVPQTSSREPAEHRIRMPHLQLLQRGQQLFFGVRAKRRRLPLENDRPVCVTWRH